MLIIFVMKSTHSCRKKYRDVARAGRICAVSLDSAWTSRQNEFASQATGLQIALLKRWDTHLHLRINFILFCSDFLILILKWNIRSSLNLQYSQTKHGIFYISVTIESLFKAGSNGVRNSGVLRIRRDREPITVPLLFESTVNTQRSMAASARSDAARDPGIDSEIVHFKDKLGKFCTFLIK